MTQARTEGSRLCCRFVVSVGLDAVAWPRFFFFNVVCFLDGLCLCAGVSNGAE